jgi:hypothetical protein
MNDSEKSSVRSWRSCYFCCRNGYFPLLVALFLTVAFLLDLFTTFGCNFIHIDIGFKPENQGWNQDLLDVGMIFYNSHTQLTDGGRLMETFHEGCRRFTPLFNQYLIGYDQVWRVSRVISWISGCSGFFCVVSHLSD